MSPTLKLVCFTILLGFCLAEENTDGSKSLRASLLVKSSTISAASWGANRIDLFAIGTNENSLYHAAYDGTSWSAWINLGGNFLSAPSAVSWGPNRLDVFAVGSTNEIYHISFDGTGWSALVSLGGWFLTVRASSQAIGKLDVFGVGIGGGVFRNAWTSSGPWSGWDNLGNIVNTAAVSDSWANNRIDLFSVGIGNTLTHNWFDGAFHSWENVPNTAPVYFTSNPAVISWSAGRLDIFGTDQLGNLRHKAWEEGGAGWIPGSGLFDNLGGQFTGEPSVASWGPGRLDVFEVAVGRDYQVRSWDGSSWSASWTSLGGQFVNAPTAISTTLGRIDVFGLGLNNNVFWNAYISSTGTWTGWAQLGPQTFLHN